MTPPGLMLAVGGPMHGRRMTAFPSGPTYFVADHGAAAQRTHTYRAQRIEGIQGVPLVLVHESVKGAGARMTTYADAVTIERDAVLQTIDEDFVHWSGDRVLQLAQTVEVAA